MQNNLTGPGLKLKNISFNLYHILIPLLFVYPILKESLSSMLVILLCVNTLLYTITTKGYKNFKPNTLLLTIPFWIILIRSFFSANFEESSRHIQHAIFFLIIPVFFSLIPAGFFTLKKLNLYISVLKNTCLLIVIIYVISFFRDVPSWKFDVVFNHDSFFRNYIYYDFKLFVIHPTYFTGILVLCSAHSFEMILKQKKYLQLIYLLIFIIITFLLLTRLNIVLLCTTLLLMLFFRSDFDRGKKIASLSGILLVSALLIYVTPGIKERFTELYESFNVKPVDASYYSTNIRKAIFDSSISIAKENWEFGVGFENLQSTLNASYRQNYDSSFYTENNYMTHNYFFYILLSSGVFGLLIYLFYIGNIIRICIKSNIFLLYVFVVNVLVLCCIEDFFYRHYGLLYFNLFLLCFIRYSENESKEKLAESN